jgi:hypothetical protein
MHQPESHVVIPTVEYGFHPMPVERMYQNFISVDRGCLKYAGSVNGFITRVADDNAWVPPLGRSRVKKRSGNPSYYENL